MKNPLEDSSSFSNARQSRWLTTACTDDERSGDVPVVVDYSASAPVPIAGRTEIPIKKYEVVG